MNTVEVKERENCFGDKKLETIFFKRERDILTKITGVFYRPAISEQVVLKHDGTVKYSCRLPIPYFNDCHDSERIKMMEMLRARGWEDANNSRICKNVMSALDLLYCVSFSNSFSGI